MATLRQIADACGCSKPHVRDVLARIGMWDGHARKDGRVWVIDQDASQAAADAISREREGGGASAPRKAPAKAAGREDQIDQIEAIRELYERLCADKDATIGDLRTRLEQAERDRDRAILEARELERDRDRWMSLEREVMSRGVLARLRNRPPRGLIGEPSSQEHADI